MCIKFCLKQGGRSVSSDQLPARRNIRSSPRCGFAVRQFQESSIFRLTFANKTFFGQVQDKAVLKSPHDVAAGFRGVAGLLRLWTLSRIGAHKTSRYSPRPQMLHTDETDRMTDRYDQIEHGVRYDNMAKRWY